MGSTGGCQGRREAWGVGRFGAPRSCAGRPGRPVCDIRGLVRGLVSGVLLAMAEEFLVVDSVRVGGEPWWWELVPVFFHEVECLKGVVVAVVSARQAQPRRSPASSRQARSAARLWMYGCLTILQSSLLGWQWMVASKAWEAHWAAAARMSGVIWIVLSSDMVLLSSDMVLTSWR